MYYVLFAVHLLISFLICVVVLLQRSKGNGLAGAFGGVGAGEAMFGSHGVTTFLHKMTIYLAIGFMATSLGLAYVTAMRSETRGVSAAGSQEVVLPVGSTPAVPADGAVDPSTTEETTTGDDIVPVIGDDASAAADSAAGATTGGGSGDGIVPEGQTQDPQQGSGGGR